MSPYYADFVQTQSKRDDYRGFENIYLQKSENYYRDPSLRNDLPSLNRYSFSYSMGNKVMAFPRAVAAVMKSIGYLFQSAMQHLSGQHEKAKKSDFLKSKHLNIAAGHLLTIVYYCKGHFIINKNVKEMAEKELEEMRNSGKGFDTKKLTKEQIPLLNKEEIPLLDKDQVPYLVKEQLKYVTAEQVPSLSLEQMEEININDLTTEKLANLKDPQVDFYLKHRWTRDLIPGHNNPQFAKKLSKEQVESIDADTISIEFMNQLSKEQISWLTPAQVNGVFSKGLNRYVAWDKENESFIQSLTKEQVQSLDGPALEHIDLSLLTNDQRSFLTTNQLRSLNLRNLRLSFAELKELNIPFEKLSAKQVNTLLMLEWSSRMEIIEECSGFQMQEIDLDILSEKEIKEIPAKMMLMIRDKNIEAFGAAKQKEAQEQKEVLIKEIETLKEEILTDVAKGELREAKMSIEDFDFHRFLIKIEILIDEVLNENVVYKNVEKEFQENESSLLKECEELRFPSEVTTFEAAKAFIQKRRSEMNEMKREVWRLDRDIESVEKKRKALKERKQECLKMGVEVSPMMTEEMKELRKKHLREHLATAIAVPVA